MLLCHKNHCSLHIDSPCKSIPNGKPIDLLYACQMAYKKHHKGDESIGWDELSEILLDALCNSMGPDEFVKWNESGAQP